MTLAERTYIVAGSARPNRGAESPSLARDLRGVLGRAAGALVAEAPPVGQLRRSNSTRRAPNHPRFAVVRELAGTAAGLLYEAIDTATGMVVALKTLNADRAGLLELKHEFRAAAGISHPNLVALHELVLDGDQGFIAMEWVPGVEWRRWVWPGGARHTCDQERLADTVGEVLDGLSALHAAGWVHRNLTPENVLVSDAGHAKICDFGAALDVRSDGPWAVRRGTPLYMSPEQIEGIDIGPASDLYSLGTIVYELLVGRPPFVGPEAEVRRAHRWLDPEPPSGLARGVPEAMENFCLRLLAKSPNQRYASAAEARRVLEATCGARPSSQRSRATAVAGSPLSGRREELAQLSSILDEARAGSFRFALVTGGLGLGKTTLVEAALARAEKAGWRVLRGACREHESVAHNAFDAIVDGAAQLLAGTARETIAPHRADLAIVARLFPVLSGLPDVARLPPPPPLASADDERDRAYDLVRRGLAVAAAARPLALWIDDLQWADEDSLALLDRLVRGGGAPGLALLGTASPDLDAESPLSRFLRRHHQAPWLSHVPLVPLSPASALEVLRDAGAAHLDAPALAAIQREAEGNPFLLVELGRMGAGGDATIAGLVRKRLTALSAEEVELVELLAVAAGPPELELARRALGDPALLDASAIQHLCALKLLRTDGKRLEFYHQRIRDAVREEISEERRRRYHLRFAAALRELRPDDHGAIYTELLLGGEVARAAAHAERAGQAAIAQLAHARAARFFAAALEHGPAADRPRVHGRYAEALDGIGRFAEAGEHYRAAIPFERGLDRIRRQVQLASCLLHTGAVEESGILVGRALRAFGHRPARAWLWKALTVAWLLFAGALSRKFFSRTPRASDGSRRQVQLQAYSLAMVYFQVIGRNLDQVEYTLRYVRLGRCSPTPEVRLETEALQLVMLTPFLHLGPRFRRRAAECFARIEALAPFVAGERARSWGATMRALHALVEGRPDRAVKFFDQLRGFEISRSGLIALQRQNSLFLAGEYDRYIDEVVPQASASCDAESALATARWAYVMKMRGEDKAARRLAAAAAARPLDEVPWTHRSALGYQLIELDLLEGDPQAAVFRATQLLPRIQRSAISPTTGAFESLDAAVRAFVAEGLRLRRAGDRKGARQMVARAQLALKRAPRICPPLFQPRVAHARAIVALACGRTRKALRHLERAASLVERARIPASRIRILDDLRQVRAALGRPVGDLATQAAALAQKHGILRRDDSAPWLALG